jgi:thiol-disulfide isomerase/thioredoxin
MLLISGVITAQETPAPADKILDEAYKIAAKEKKQVMIVFHASWCGWCKKFDASVADPSVKDYFEKSFVIRHLVVLEPEAKKNLENPGATEIFKKYAGDKSGIPFFLIFNKKGVLLGDSNIRAEGDGLDKPGKNMGCPASDEEVAAFVALLKKVSKVSDSEATAIAERFKKNK